MDGDHPAPVPHLCELTSTWPSPLLIGEVDGPAAALALVDQLDLEVYYPYHATRADLLRRLGRDPEAQAAYERAAELAPTDAEREFLRRGGRTSVIAAGTVTPRSAMSGMQPPGASMTRMASETDRVPFGARPMSCRVGSR